MTLLCSQCTHEPHILCPQAHQRPSVQGLWPSDNAHPQAGSPAHFLPNLLGSVPSRRHLLSLVSCAPRTLGMCFESLLLSLSFSVPSTLHSAWHQFCPLQQSGIPPLLAYLFPAPWAPGGHRNGELCGRHADRVQVCEGFWWQHRWCMGGLMVAFPLSPGSLGLHSWLVLFLVAF